MGCLASQKLDCVMSRMFWCTDLQKVIPISSNAVNHLQHFLHLQHFFVILLADFSPQFNENEGGITKFQYHNRELMDCRKWETYTEDDGAVWLLHQIILWVLSTVTVNSFSLVKNHTVKTCPVEAVNVQDNLLLYKVTFIFQCTVATFYRWCGQIYNLLVWNFLRIPCIKTY